MAVGLDNLTLRYGAIEALRAVTATAPAASITAVIGPNAAGKSTLLRCAIGALTPSSGRALIDGTPAHQLRTRQLAMRIAYVPQRSSVAAAFTVRQVVELGRYAMADDPGRIDAALRRLDLMDLADRPYPALSVGQQQRVTLARATAQLEPEGHLLLDEPFSAMDLRHVADATGLLREIAADGVTVIIATHDLPLAATVADEIWLLTAGRLAAAGPVDEVMTAERLHSVFDVGFRPVTAGDHSLLLPDVYF